jgi:hypothetical protein
MESFPNPLAKAGGFFCLNNKETKQPRPEKTLFLRAFVVQFSS